MKGMAFLDSDLSMDLLMALMSMDSASRSISMYFFCQAGHSLAAKMMIFFSFLGSKVAALPFDSFFMALPSADVMFVCVVRTNSRAAVREALGSGTLGQSAFWMVSLFLSTSSQMYSAQ